MEGQTDTQTDRRTDGHRDGQTDTQTETDRRTHILTWLHDEPRQRVDDGAAQGRMEGRTDGWMDRRTDGHTDGHRDGQTDGHTQPPTDLLHDEPGQHVHDEASQPRVGRQRLDDGAHQQHGEGVLLQQLLRHHRQHLRRVDVALREAQVGGWGGRRGGTQWDTRRVTMGQP